MRANVTETQDWFEYGEGDTAELSELLKKIIELKKLIEDALAREEELDRRGYAVDDAFEKLSQLYTRMLTVNETKIWIPETEREEVFTSINETITWVQDKVIEQAGVPLYEPPVLTHKQVNEKVKAVDYKVGKMERRKEIEKDKDKDKKKEEKDKADKDSDLPPDFINFGGGDWSNVKFDNVKFGDKVYSNVNKDDKKEGEDAKEESDTTENKENQTTEENSDDEKTDRTEEPAQEEQTDSQDKEDTPDDTAPEEPESGSSDDS
jgi:hypothetical protein